MPKRTIDPAQFLADTEGMSLEEVGKFARKLALSLITHKQTTFGIGNDKPKQEQLTDGQWLEQLKKKEVYAGIDVGREYGRCFEWCEVNRKQFSRRRFINWLNRQESRIGHGGHPVKVGTVAAEEGNRWIGGRDLWQQNRDARLATLANESDVWLRHDGASEG